MKHAILIIAHGNYPHLMSLINRFDSNYQIYIHLDKKMGLTKLEKDTLSNLPIVKGIYSRYKINWAGFNMLKAILFLLKQSYKDEENSYFHLLSGQDYLVKSVPEFTKFMEENNGKEFLEFHTLPYSKWDNGTYRRYEYYFFHDLFNYKTKNGYQWIFKILRFQMKRNLKRRMLDNFETIYGGCCWFTLSRNCIRYVLEYTRKHPSFYRRLKYTFAPEETYFHSIILNSCLKENVINHSLRYVDWRYRNGNYPANLDESDFEILCSTDVFFARKFHSTISAGLIKLIDERILK